MDWSFDLTFWTWAGLLMFLWLTQLLYYLIIYNRPYTREKKREKQTEVKPNCVSVSVVVVAENESENLRTNLPLILEQDYPNFEVIVVNMGSTDETESYLEELSAKYPHLYHTFLPDGAERINAKKLALTLGIKAAKNDVLLFTEAYCRPLSKQWIESFAQSFDQGSDIVLGFCNLSFTKKFIGRKYILYDNLKFGLKYLSMAALNQPFMGVNRNLAYKRSLFFENKGFSSVLTYEYGEDDLFINRVWKGRDVDVVLSANSLTETNIVDGYKVWKNLSRKYRHSQKEYKGIANFVFGIESLTTLLFYIVFGISVYIGVAYARTELIVLSTLLFLTRFGTQLLVYNRYNKHLGVNQIGLRLICYDIFQSLSNLGRLIRRRIR